MPKEIKEEIITIKRKDGYSFTGTALECAEEMVEDANRSRLLSYNRLLPLPPHWLFEDFCKENGINFYWDEKDGYNVF